jgi:hypothetical protein
MADATELEHAAEAIGQAAGGERAGGHAETAPSADEAALRNNAASGSHIGREN